MAAVMLWATAAAAQAPALPLPSLGLCQAASHPQLPDKWRASYLMAPFSNAQLILGDFRYDGTHPALRASLYGLKGGALDLLLAGEATYVLTAHGSQILACENLGDTGWRPWPRDWLHSRSQCAGSAPIATTSVDWWKTPIEPQPSSYWIWYKTSDQTPFRLVFPFPNPRLAVLGEFALSYQVRFGKLASPDLAPALAACQAKSAVNEDPRRALAERLAALSSARGTPSSQIKELMPELAACPAGALPRWPQRLALTGLMTPFDFSETAYPTEVLYDWSIPAQRSRIYFPADSTSSMQDALMLEGGGTNVTHYREQAPICRGALPGTIRPDWAERAPCSCEAMINGKTPLTPHGTTRIIACPLASPRAAWGWYARDDRPLAFAVTSLQGDEDSGLFAVLDYQDWAPATEGFGRGVFDRPTNCRVPPPPPGPASEEVAARQRQCATCHANAATR